MIFSHQTTSQLEEYVPRVEALSLKEIRMNSLLNNDFAPITFRFGFIEVPFPALSDAFIHWFRTLGEKQDLKTDFRTFDAPLASAFSTLEPLTTPLDRYLLVETASRWTAIFANGLRVNDVCSPVSYLPTILKCRGLEVGHAPDLSHMPRKDAIRKWGHTLFALNGPEQTDWLNRIRYVHVWNDAGGGEFSAEGEVQPFEELGNYEKTKIKDRFSAEMLVRYCRALDIELNDADFYGPGHCAVRIAGRKASGNPCMSIAEARSHLDL